MRLHVHDFACEHIIWRVHVCSFVRELVHCVFGVRARVLRCVPHAPPPPHRTPDWDVECPPVTLARYAHVAAAAGVAALEALPDDDATGAIRASLAVLAAAYATGRYLTDVEEQAWYSLYMRTRDEARRRGGGGGGGSAGGGARGEPAA